MSTFVNAIKNQSARTENGMAARASTADAITDLFFKIGAMRGKDVIPQFVAAYAQDAEKAVRVALWARDVRGGAGERKIPDQDDIASLCTRLAALRFDNKEMKVENYEQFLEDAGNILNLAVGMTF